MAKRDAALTNIPAEKAVLGALLRAGSPHAFFQVADMLKADMFSVPLHQLVFGAIRDICEEGKKPSRTLLVSRLPEEDESGQSVATFLAVLMKDADEVESALDFAPDVADMAARRRMIRIAEDLAKRARSFDENSTDIAAEAEAAVHEVVSSAAPRRPRRLSDVVSTVMRQARQAREADILPGFTTGLPSLDEILGLIRGDDMGVILGSQGDGKSSLATQIGMHVAMSRPVLMFQLEMSDEAIATRELAAQAKISASEIEEGAMDVWQREQLLEAEQKLQQSEFYIYDEGEMTIRQMKAQALSMKRSQGLGMMIIDQLDKVKSDNKHRDKFERFSEVTRDVKNLAKSLRIPIILLAQRTRGAQRRDDPTPFINDADAPSIERDADWILAPWREENWLRQNRPNEKAGGDALEKWEQRLYRAKDVAKVICLKRRRGEAFEQRTFKWDGALTRFRELDQ